jgi:radical SAM superfamily enzyme YgiQ (UPF0313 family)
MKILLVSFYNDEAYGLRILHSILVHNGYDAKMLFLKLYSKQQLLTKIEEDLFINFITKHNFNFIVFSLVSPNWQLYKRLYPRIRKAGTFRIILGGWQPTLNPEECIKYSDYVIRGEGETAILYLIKDSKFPYIFFGCLHKNFSYPALSFNDYESYWIEDNTLFYGDPYKENTRYGTMIGRGCPYSCTYCSNSFMKKLYPNWGKIRYRNPEEIKKELIIVKQELLNVKQINFYDEVFMPPKEWREDFFKWYKKEINLPFYCMFYPGTCSYETAKMLKEAGLAGVWLGIQSGSERVRKEVFKRNCSNEIVYKQVDVFQKYKINVKYDFIFDNPFETPKETLETLRMMKKLPEPKSFNLFSLKFFPNTEITQMALEQGLITQKQIDDQLSIDCPKYTVSEEKEKQIMEIINV